MSTTFIVTVVVIVVVVALLVLVRRLRKGRSTETVGDLGADATSNKQVYVGNLSYQVSEQDLKDFFSDYGTIHQVRIVRNYSSGRSKGFGFVTYGTVAEANKALVAHGQKYQGRTIVVRIAKPR